MEDGGKGRGKGKEGGGEERKGEEGKEQDTTEQRQHMSVLSTDHVVVLVFGLEHLSNVLQIVPVC